MNLKRIVVVERRILVAASTDRRAKDIVNRYLQTGIPGDYIIGRWYGSPVIVNVFEAATLDTDRL